MPTRDEMETTMTIVRSDDRARITTTDPRDLRRLQVLAASSDHVTEVRSGDGWGEFTVKAENFRPLLAIRAKRERSAAQIAASKAAGDRLASQAPRELRRSSRVDEALRDREGGV